MHTAILWRVQTVIPNSQLFWFVGLAVGCLRGFWGCLVGKVHKNSVMRLTPHRIEYLNITDTHYCAVVEK